MEPLLLLAAWLVVALVVSVAVGSALHRRPGGGPAGPLAPDHRPERQDQVA